MWYGSNTPPEGYGFGVAEGHVPQRVPAPHHEARFDVDLLNFVVDRDVFFVAFRFAHGLEAITYACPSGVM